MSKTSLKGCRRVLEAKRGELLSGNHSTESIAVERVPDSMDELNLEIEQNMAVDTLNRKAFLLGQVTEALERMAGGKYGVCQGCGRPISPKRLAALPWAALCIECQEAAENGPGQDKGASLGLMAGSIA